MNDTSPADDELLSSSLDGEATPEGIARIEADPALLARVEELRAARDLVATPVTPLPARDVDTVIGAALDASATSPVVTTIASARRRRHQRTRTVVAIAAGVLVLAIAVPLLNTVSSDSDSDDTAVGEMDPADTTNADDGLGDAFSLEGQPADEAFDGSDAADDMAEGNAPAPDATTDDSDTAEDAAAVSTTTAGSDELLALDPVLDEDELADAVRARLDDDTARTVELTENARLLDRSPVACAEEFAGATPTADLVVVDSDVTTVGGTATVVVLTLRADTGDLVVYTAPLETCAPIVVLELDG